MNKLNKNNDMGHVNMSNARPSVKTKKAGGRKSSKKSSKASVTKIPPAVKTTKTDGSTKHGPNITRRSVIIGACGVGAVAAGGLGVKYAADHSTNKTTNSAVLEVDQENVFVSDNLEEASTDQYFQISREINLPEGSLCWANNSNWIAALIPTEKSKPLCTMELISKKNGKRNVILKEAVNKKDGYEIFDVRANDTGIVWAEVNVASDEWYVYASNLNANLDIDPTIIDKGNSDFDIAHIAITDNKVMWSIMPKADGNFKSCKSLLKGISFNNLKSIAEADWTSNAKKEEDLNSSKNVLFASHGRMQTPIYSCGNSVVISPRSEDKTIFYQLTCVDEDGNVVDNLKLPQNMKPLEAGYGNTGFNFSFDAIYNYGGGISNLGTYTPMTKPTGNGTENYSSTNWLNFARTPSAPPCWCNGHFIVRSSTSVCVVDMTAKKYCVLDRPNASDNYGDYLASMGNVDKIVTFAGINDTKVSGDVTKMTTLHIWSPV